MITSNFSIYHKYWNECISVIKLHQKKILLIAGIAFSSLAIAYACLFLYGKIKLKRQEPDDPNDPNAQYQLGDYYSYGIGNVEANAAAKAFSCYLKAAEANHPDAQLKVGICYAMGKNVEKDHEEAFRWIKQSAEAGEASAQACIGLYYRSHPKFRDLKEASKWFHLADEGGCKIEAIQDLKKNLD